MTMTQDRVFPKKNSKFDERLEDYGKAAKSARQKDPERLVAKGATMTAAAAALMSMATSADAAIMYSGIQNEVASPSFASVDLNSDGKNDFRFGGYDVFGFITALTDAGVRISSQFNAINLASGAAIGPSNTDFDAGANLLIPNFGTTGTGIAGIYLSSNGGGARHFGWI